MTLLQLLELAGEMAAAWSGRHPIWTTLVIIGTVVGSTVTVKKLELPVYRWARDWLNAWLDGLGKRLMASLMKKVDEIATEQKNCLSGWRATSGKLNRIGPPRNGGTFWAFPPG